MTKVILRYFGPLRLRLGLKGESVELDEGNTLGDLLEKLRGKHGGLFTPRELAAYIVFLERGAKAVNLSAGEETLQDGDVVSIIPRITGG